MVVREKEYQLKEVSVLMNQFSLLEIELLMWSSALYQE